MSEKNHLFNLDLCTSCGTCLAVCPVYKVNLSERYSPRGKLNLIYAVKKGIINPYDNYVIDTLESCLMCGRCEGICPADIPLLKYFRDFKGKYLKERYPSPEIIEFCKKIPTFSGLFKILGSKIFQLNRLESKWNNFRTPKTIDFPKKISLFTGCVHKYLVNEPVNYTKKIFSNIIIPESQTCCGMPYWSGGKENTRFLIERNVDVFLKDSPDIIITTCESCSYMIKNFWISFFNQGDEYYNKVIMFASRIIEFTDFISKFDLFQANKGLLKDLQGKILFHSPCHKTTKDSYKIIKELFDNRVELMSDECCGFGGMFSLKKPHLSKEIFMKKIGDGDLNEIEYIVTNCSGCQLQFKRNLIKINGNIRIIHPIQLIEPK